MSQEEKYFHPSEEPDNGDLELQPTHAHPKKRAKKTKPKKTDPGAKLERDDDRELANPKSEEDEIVGYASDQQKMIIRKLNAFAKDPQNIENETRLVLVQFYLLKLEQINTTEQTCHIDFGISMWWKSPEIVGNYGDEWDYEKEVKWWPELEFSGEIQHTALLENHGSVWINECFTKHGIMNNYQRWKAELHVPMQLHEFPFEFMLDEGLNTSILRNNAKTMMTCPLSVKFHRAMRQRHTIDALFQHDLPDWGH